jgi:hypothetical protein
LSTPDVASTNDVATTSEIPDFAAAGIPDFGNSRRLQAAGDSAFDLSAYMTFEVVRGDEDSAPLEKLGFTVNAGNLKADGMAFKLIFDYPLMVSIGAKKDKMVATIVDGSFFASSDTGMPIPPGTTIEQLLPKMVPGEEFVMALDKA